MKFFHVYSEPYFEGLVKNSLINEDTGFKIQHAFSVPEHLKFNELASFDGAFYKLIKEGRYPFYVDRIAGGITYHRYDFDKRLVDAYRDILGDWFLGFQLHESASNRRHDWKGIIERMDGGKGPYDEQELAERSWRDFAVMPDGTKLYSFSQGTPAEYARMHYAETPEEFDREIEELFRRRMLETDGNILPCDSFFLFTRLQNEVGMRSFMPEVGCQIPGMRIMVALARGMARAYKKTWGAYYECWIGNLEEGYSMPVFNREEGNEWYLTQETHPDDFTSNGANGGSSRRLQNRIYYHALMSGADYFSEEWGLNCSYSDMNTFELSAYGLAKKNFIDDSRRLRGMRAMTPFAIVLPKDFYAIELPDVYDAWRIGEHRDMLMHCKLDAAQKEYYGHIEDVLKLIYTRNGEIFGNESHVLTNSRFGDLFDILYEDVPTSALEAYDTLIDATPDGRIAQRLAPRFRVLRSDSPEDLEHALHEREREVLPVVADNLLWLLSEDQNGNRYITLFNNEGNERSIKRGDTVRHEADARVRLRFSKPVETLSLWKSSTDRIAVQRENEDTYIVDLPATEFAIFTY